MYSKLSVIGLGVVGSAIYETFKKKLDGVSKVYGYDKFKNGGIGNLNDCLNSEVIILCLPTPYSSEKKDYDLDPIEDVLSSLNMLEFNGLVVIKSTINPGTSELLSNKYNKLNLVHNPEFLTARNAQKDFENQIQIVLGKTKSCNNIKFINFVEFYKKLWPETIISVCNSGESELMKLGCNTFYSVKIQYFTELYLICKKNNLDFNKVKNMMITNNGINPNYTNIPGHDGSISYSGMCFPKDTNALCSYMKNNSLPCDVLDATIKERNLMRKDQVYEENN